MSERSTAATERRAYHVTEFCRAYGISRALFYELLRAGKAPRTFTVGRRRLVSVESAERWRQRREAATGAP